MQEQGSKKGVKIYDHMGKPWAREIPTVKSSKWMRQIYYKGPARVGEVDKDGKTGAPIREELVRAQVPYCVVLLIYNSKFQVTPDEREYFVYAPLEVSKAAEMAVRLWQRWERPKRPEFNFGDMRETYPKIGEGVMAEPMADEDFESHWKDVVKRKHRCAGDKDDPWGFTCLDDDVKLYKHTDFQHGLDTKIT